jgi:hypothetical protein
MIENCNLLVPRPHSKDGQATGEAFSPQKRTSSTSKLEFSSLFWVILALLNPDPDPVDQNECGFGSTTLKPKSKMKFY